MPTYEYQCLSCGKKFEVFQKITDSPLKECIFCQGKVKRLVGGGCGLIFKGSGFYITDYKRSNKNNTEKFPSQDKSNKNSPSPSKSVSSEKEK
ncbi:MAG: zinc ribbon domain-containing protein [Candidatus Omnitrophota bacterium]|nr:MAG: zinc ribbon domain-containing protein [Candidatus Omnitrophota bacterium]RKY46338.1 MAG: zinc ribbon domain-containing protein [Candidatus Omnitrophota bacterium]HDN86087.1 zinc ribbon domain-containing protein [Candidatus Omnitrophota bacterium]